MKVTKTYSIESKLFDKFDDICKKKNLNRSQWMEDKIKDFVAKEMIIDPKSYYKLRFDTEDNYLTVVEKKDNFITMSNGNRIDVFDFEKMYEEVDPFVTSVVNAINGINTNVESVDPDDFLNKGITDPETLKEIFEKVDPKKCGEKWENFDFNKIQNIPYRYDNRPVTATTRQNIIKASDEEKEEFIRKHNEEEKIKKVTSTIRLQQNQSTSSEIRDSQGNLISPPSKDLAKHNPLAKLYLELEDDEKTEKGFKLPSPTEPRIDIGQRVTLDDGKDTYFVTKKCNISGAVWIQKLDDAHMGLCKEVEYIDNLCRLKIIR